MSITAEKYTKSKKKDNLLASTVRRLGNPVSTLLLHHPCSIFQIPEVDGLIGYQMVRNCAVVFGDPVCSIKDRPELTRAFHRHCQHANLSIVYLLTTKSFAEWAIKNGCRTSIQAGALAIINPTTFHKTQKLRWKINQALHHGVEIKEYKNDDHELEKQMKVVNEEWRKSKRGQQLHLGAITFPLDRTHERIFYASHKGDVIGLLLLSPIDSHRAWVMISHIALHNAPVGTTEHLVGAVIEMLAQENCHYLCLGATAGNKLGEIVGTSRISKAIAHAIFMMTTWMFHLNAKKIYLDKFHPDTQPTFCLFSDRINVNDLLAVKHILDSKL